MTTLKYIREKIASTGEADKWSVISKADLSEINRDDSGAKLFEGARHMAVLTEDVDISIGWKRTNHKIGVSGDFIPDYLKALRSYGSIHEVRGDILWCGRAVEKFYFLSAIEGRLYLPKPTEDDKGRCYIPKYQMNIAKAVDYIAFGELENDEYKKLEASFYSAVGDIR